MALEEAPPVVEEVKPEEVKPTPPEVEPTVKTRTDAEFQKALDVAVGKGLSTVQSQLSLSKTEATKAQASLKASQADYQALQEEIAELEKLNLEDTDVRAAYTDKKAARESLRDIARKTAELEDKRYESELKEWQVGMDNKAQELVAESGININEFVGCKTQEEMEVKALRYLKDNPKKEEEPPKFDTGLSSIRGVDFDKMSPDDKLKYGFQQLKK